ncbi:MAG TPA: hypothetical protein VIW46_13420 [Acidimicrobiia bacterium]|jgi:hypothetical protein
MLTFILWLVLAVVSLPLALLVLVLYPVVWLLALPFRLIGVSVSAVFDLLESVLRLPSRLLRGATR